MRKFILIATMVLLSASAQAGVSRGPTLALNDEPVTAEQPKTVDTPKAVEAPKAVEVPKASERPTAEAPKLVERPAAVDTSADQPKVDPSKSAPAKTAEKPKRKRESTEARVIHELHRHGIYW
jgi:hypothetical protein